MFSLAEESGYPAEFKKELITRIHKNEIFVRTECPKGEMGFHLISDGGPEPFRCKTRSPAFHNLHVIEKVGQGQMISDLCATVGTLDLVLGEIDR